MKQEVANEEKHRKQEAAEGSESQKEEEGEEIMEEVANEENQEIEEAQETEEMDEISEEEEYSKLEEGENEAERQETGKEADHQIIDLSQVIPVQASPSARSYSGPTDISIVNTRKNGKRIVIKKEFVDYLGDHSIEIAFLDDNSLIIAPKGAGIASEAFALRTYGKNYVLYKSSLVEEISSNLSLNFEGRTTNGLKAKKTTAAGGTKIVLASKE